MDFGKQEPQKSRVIFKDVYDIRRMISVQNLILLLPMSSVCCSLESRGCRLYKYRPEPFYFPDRQHGPQALPTSMCLMFSRQVPQLGRSFATSDPEHALDLE